MKKALVHFLYWVIIVILGFLLLSAHQTLQKVASDRAARVAEKAVTPKWYAAGVPLNQPNVDNFAVQAWANIVAVRAYSFDFLNYKQSMTALSQFFIPRAWTDFQGVLNSSNLMQMSLTQKMSVGAVATGPVSITKQGVQNGYYTWHVLLPLKVTLANQKQKIEQHYIVNITVVRSRPHQGVNGLAVESLNIVNMPTQS